MAGRLSQTVALLIAGGKEGLIPGVRRRARNCDDGEHPHGLATTRAGLGALAVRFAASCSPMDPLRRPSCWRSSTRNSVAGKTFVSLSSTSSFCSERGGRTGRAALEEHPEGEARERGLPDRSPRLRGERRPRLRGQALNASPAGTALRQDGGGGVHGELDHLQVPGLQRQGAHGATRNKRHHQGR